MTAVLVILTAAAVILVQVLLHQRTIRFIDALAEMVSDNIARKEMTE